MSLQSFPLEEIQTCDHKQSNSADPAPRHCIAGCRQLTVTKHISLRDRHGQQATFPLGYCFVTGVPLTLTLPCRVISKPHDQVSGVFGTPSIRLCSCIYGAASEPDGPPRQNRLLPGGTVATGCFPVPRRS